MKRMTIPMSDEEMRNLAKVKAKTGAKTCKIVRRDIDRYLKEVDPIYDLPRPNSDQSVQKEYQPVPRT